MRLRQDRRGLVLLGVAGLVLLALVGARCSEREGEVGAKAVRERIAINAGADSWIHSGADLRFYSDRARSTETGRLDGAGGWQVAAPTAMPTATPGLSVYNAGVGAIVDLGGSALEYQFDRTAFDLQSNYIEADIDTEHLMLPSVVSTAITYTAAAGGTGAVATIADGEIWFVHAVFVNVTTDFDCTGDDATLVIGDGNDADGFVVLADAELQAADTEQTGSPAGWQGLVAATMGVYLDGAVSSAPQVYAPSGAAETIDWLVDEGAGETITAGAATIYVVYTRIQ